MNNNEINNDTSNSKKNNIINNQIIEQNTSNAESSNANIIQKQKRPTNFSAIIIAFLITSFVSISICATQMEEKEIEALRRQEIYQKPEYNNSATIPITGETGEKEEEITQEEPKEPSYIITNNKTPDDFKTRDEAKEEEIYNKIVDKLGETYYIINGFNDLLYNENYNISEINDSLKARLVVNYMIYNKSYVTNLNDSTGFGSNYMISTIKHQELYNKAFDQTIEINENIYKNIDYPISNKKEYDMTSTFLGCPHFDKIEGDNAYFNYRCGGSTPRRFISFIYDFKEDGDTIEVYKSVAYTIEEYILEEDRYAIEIYKDFDYNKESLYDTFFNVEGERFELNEYNKDKFNNFKLTFKKNGKGNYVFEKSELINR